MAGRIAAARQFREKLGAEKLLIPMNMTNCTKTEYHFEQLFLWPNTHLFTGNPPAKTSESVCMLSGVPLTS